MTTQFLSPVGRLVQGDILTGSTTDNKGQPLITKTGPNKGQPRVSFYIAIALPKTNHTTKNFWEDAGPPDAQHPEGAYQKFFHGLYAEARSGFPAIFNAQGVCTHPRFAWKVADGDGIDADGKPNAEKPGFAGHWIVKFGGSFAPKLLMNKQYINDVNAVKRGYFVRVAGDAQPNIGSDVPGLYMNHAAVEFVAYGEEIRGGIDAVAAFAAPAGVLPAGATMTPPTPTGPSGLPNAPQVPQPGVPQQPQYAPPVAHPQQYAPPVAPQPNHAFVQNAIAPPIVPHPQQYALPVAPVYVPGPNSQGYTVEQWLAVPGANVETYVGQGIFVRQA